MKSMKVWSIGSAGAAMLLASSAMTPSAAETLNIPGLQNGTIGFVLTSSAWGLYQTPDGKAECPEGFNEGPREQFKALYPNGGTVEGTQLERESASRYPMDKEDNFAYRDVKGVVGIGMNLDGKVGANDFTSPDGVKGVDNQLYRAIGCTRLFRGPDGTYAHFTEMWVREMGFNRVLVELTGVDSLENDPQVDVTLYRGKDKLITDASGANIIAGGSNRVEDRFSKRFTKTLKGKIENGVLVTAPADLDWVWSVFYDHPGYYGIKQARLQLNLAPAGDRAEGMIAGYTTIDTFYQQLVRAWSTHHSSYGGLSQPSLFRALHRLADGVPDEKGAMTALSSSIQVKFVQSFIEHPDAKVAAVESTTKSTVEPARR
ncbi:MAG: hypothetical protein AB7H70_09305 [Rhodospirillaceae bacterium]